MGRTTRGESMRCAMLAAAVLQLCWLAAGMDAATPNDDTLEIKGPVSTGSGAWASQFQMDQAKEDSSSLRAEFKSAASGTASASNYEKLPKKVRKFCGTAAGQCSSRSGEEQNVAAAKSEHQGSNRGLRSGNNLAGARNTFLKSLKSRLRDLEGGLGQMKKSVAGRRLLSAESSALAFPQHFYKVFGGLNQVEAASFSVLQHVEKRICKIYNKFCLDVDGSLMSASRDWQTLKSAKTISSGRSRFVGPVTRWQQFKEAKRAGSPSSDLTSDPNFGNAQREYIRPSEFLPEPGLDHSVVNDLQQPQAPARAVQRDTEDGMSFAEQNILNRLRDQHHRREERRERRRERRHRREEKREQHEERIIEGPRSVDRSKTYVNVYVNQGPAQEATKVVKREVAPQTVPRESVHKAAPSTQPVRSDGKPIRLDKNGLCGMAEPICNRDGQHQDGKASRFPTALYEKYGLKGGPESATFADIAEADVKICRDAKCICDKVGCQQVIRKTQKMVGEDGEEGDLAEGEAEEEPEMTPAELEEWWVQYSENYNPGGAGAPGFHPDQAYPPKQPIQYEDGTWSIDPETGVGPKACIFMYAGIHAGLGAVEGANDALANATAEMDPIGSEQIKKFWSFHPTAVRNVLWDDDESNPIHKILYMVIPSLHDYPTLPHTTKIDIREWTFSGRTTLFLGGVINIYVINEIFNVHLEPQYMPGPYEWNERYAVGTPFEHVPRKVFEQGNTRAGMTGVLIASIPIGGKSFFDTNGASVAMCFHHGMGRVCYVNQEFIRPMSDYGYSVWVDIVRAALNGGTCDDPCAEDESKSSPACLKQAW